MSRIGKAVLAFLSDIRLFSDLILEMPLRGYQLEPISAVLDSILHQKGLEFLLIFPRQSGKNEAVAHLLVYLLNVFQRVGGNIVYGAVGDGLGLGIARLEERLHNKWNRGAWTAAVKPKRRCLGNACVIFLSSHPAARSRGHTAHHLLVLDETQDQAGPHIEAVFTPMRAANNASALYIGTVKSTSDYLWQKKLELERMEKADGQRRIWMVRPEQVTAENRAYKDFLDRQIQKHGRHHPIVASEYFLEPIDADGGLFDARRRALMHGDHPRQRTPWPGDLYVATLDVAGQDEATTDPIAQLAHPARDYTVGTVFRAEYPPQRTHSPGPTYKAVDVFVDHGSRHFEDLPGQPALVDRLIAWLNHWQIAHLVADQSGVGLGLVAWLQEALGTHRVTGYNFSGPGKKAALGSAFLSLVETGRFKYWAGDEQIPESDGWWFWNQAAACQYQIPPEGRFDHDLKWAVPANHRTDTPAGPQPTHDDRLLSAALVAELDRLLCQHKIRLGRAESAIIRGIDPLQSLSF